MIVYVKNKKSYVNFWNVLSKNVYLRASRYISVGLFFLIYFSIWLFAIVDANDTSIYINQH